jgi:hypothetical protein
LEIEGGWGQAITFLTGSVTYSHTFVLSKLPTKATGILGIHLLATTAKLNFENQILTLHRKPNCHLVSEVQQDSLEDSYRRSKGNEMAILTDLSDSAPKDSVLT